MGLFNFLKKSSKQVERPIDPYSEKPTSLVYNLLFCDDLELYKANTQQPFVYPFDILFSELSSLSDLQKIIESDTEPRVKLLAYRKQQALTVITIKELLGVIVEVSLDGGLDVLASFNNGTARYINQTGKIIIWEKEDETIHTLTKELFDESQKIIQQIGPWDKARLPYPIKGNTRITFLVSDGLYFGEASTEALFSDSLAGSALLSATKILKYLTVKAGGQE